MKEIQLPAGFHWERLRRDHPRKRFTSGEQGVDDWLRTKAFQSQAKHLTVTRILIDEAGEIAGYYSLASGQIDLSDLPVDITKGLPRRAAPVAVLAWLGVASAKQGQGLGRLLLARALRDCYEASETFPFIAVILDCISEAAKAFYQKWHFQELPGRPYRLFLSTGQLAALMNAE